VLKMRNNNTRGDNMSRISLRRYFGEVVYTRMIRAVHDGADAHMVAGICDIRVEVAEYIISVLTCDIRERGLS
jgi:nucleoid-associated protein YgaU